MKIAVAYIRGPRGFKGELAAGLFRPGSGSIKPGMIVTISGDDKTRELEVEYVKKLRKGIGVKLIGIDDETEAELWRGAEISIELEKLEPLGAKEYYHFQIEGAEVKGIDGARIGEVVRVDSSAGNDILIVRTADNEIMIPFVREIVKSVDIDNRKIVVEAIEGLY
jgi:16S rRNA processing protein RimM